MSRIGKTPVPIPDKLTVDFDGLTVTVKGPKGEYCESASKRGFHF